MLRRSEPFLPPVGSRERAELYKKFAKRTFFDQTAFKRSQWRMPEEISETDKQSRAQSRSQSRSLTDPLQGERPWTPVYPCDPRNKPIATAAAGGDTLSPSSQPRLPRVQSEPWKPGAYFARKDFQANAYTVKQRTRDAFGALQFHGVNDKNLAMRLGNLESAMKRTRAEVDSFQGKDLLLAKSLQARSFAISELNKVEAEYRNVADEIERRKQNSKDSKRRKKDRSAIDKV